MTINWWPNPAKWSVSLARARIPIRGGFSLFGFDPYDLTARRKYFFLFNEKATASPFDEGKRFFKPKQVLVFEAELVMAEALARPARREAERRHCYS